MVAARRNVVLVRQSGGGAALPAGLAGLAEYVARTARLAPLLPRWRARPLPADLQPPRPHPQPQNLALELTESILYDDANLRSQDSLWNGRPQQYFESMNYGGRPDSEKDYDNDSLAP